MAPEGTRVDIRPNDSSNETTEKQDEAVVNFNNATPIGDNSDGVPLRNNSNNAINSNEFSETTAKHNNSKKHSELTLITNNLVNDTTHHPVDFAQFSTEASDGNDCSSFTVAVQQANNSSVAASKFEDNNGRKHSASQLDDLNPKDGVAKRRMLWNAAVLSVAFMVHFTAFTGTSNLQSSLHRNGLGTAALGALYVAMVLSSLLLSVPLIRWLGPKRTLAVGFALYTPYVAVQIVPGLATLLPAAILLGTASGPLWTAQGLYLSALARPLSRATGQPVESVLARLFGVFYCVYQLSEVWGNLLSSVVLSAPPGGPAVNVTCGAGFVPGAVEAADNSNLTPPDHSQILTLMALYLGCMGVAVGSVALALDAIPRDGNKSSDELTGIRLLAVTGRLLKDHRQLLLLPLTVWMGMAQVFKGADYTEAYVTCAWGVSSVGLVMVSYGVAHSASSLISGLLARSLGRQALLGGAALLHGGLLLALLLWTPRAPWGLFLVAALWGVADGVWLVHVNSLYGILFPGREPAAYSNFRLWKSLGYIIAYFYSAYLPTDVKLYVLLVLLAVGISGYFTLEWLEAREKRADKS